MNSIVATFYLMSVGQLAAVTRDYFFCDQGVLD
jgi:hypothetical protein